jgi:hypothetical protein
MDAAVRFERRKLNAKAPLARGFCFDKREPDEDDENVVPAPLVHQFLKQWRPNGPECQPGGQLYIGRHPP